MEEANLTSEIIGEPWQEAPRHPCEDYNSSDWLESKFSNGDVEHHSGHRQPQLNGLELPNFGSMYPSGNKYPVLVQGQ